ncbi:MAG: class I SAM-dependent methyltransferase [Planctomycetes bacterium]|nr:class I SAM-dependent methyltransferase [Planctomycetota bacterium]
MSRTPHVPVPFAHRGPRARLFAALYVRFSGRHEVLVRERKDALFAGLKGRVLELGAGAGANLARLCADVEYAAVEPNPWLRRELERTARELGRAALVRDGVAEALPFEDASFDAVVTTLVLCSVSDVERTLAEIRRVLRPGGTYVFLEHVAARAGSARRFRQRLARPFTRSLACGCHPDRELEPALRSAGFAHVDLEAFEVPLPIVGPHVAGRARR